MNIFNYLDYRLFLKEHIQDLQKFDKKFSHRWIAKKAGIKSPQLISMIISKKRNLSEENARLLSFAFGLSVEEEEYLLLLLDLAHSENSDRQIELIQKIKIHFQNGLFKDLPDNGFEYLRKWYYPAIRESVTLKEFIPSSDWVASLFGISRECADEALEFLKATKFIVNENGKWVRNEPSLRANDYVHPIIMAQYHMQMLERSFLAIRLPRECRYFDTLTVGIPKSLFAEVKNVLKRAVREIDLLAESYPKREDVFQLNLQFFSLTNDREREIK